MTSPRISVVVPLYNKAEFVVAAVQSALQQQPPPLEVIVVDDGSTDGGAERLLEAGLLGVRLVRQVNGGVAAARNRGVKEAKGELVAFLDADDGYRAGFLQAIIQLALRHPKAGLLCTGYSCVWPDGREERRVMPGVRSPGLVPTFHAWWVRCSFTCASAIAVRKAALQNLDTWFPVGERLGEDQDLWFRLAERFEVAYWPESLAAYRMQVQGSATQQSEGIAALLPCYQRLGARLDRGEVSPIHRRGAERLLASHYLNVARQAARVGDGELAWALWRDPRARANILYWLRTAAYLALRS